MEQKIFVWNQTRPLSVPGMVLAAGVPSAIAFAGFHGAAPALIAAGLPSLYAWYLVAMLALAGFVAAGVVFLAVEARSLGVPFGQRACLARVGARGWLWAAAVIVATIALSAAAKMLIDPFMHLTGLRVPSYSPFFLSPNGAPSAAPTDGIAPGIALRGNYGLLGLHAGVLVLNIAAEELYFRAWMLPKLWPLGKASWLVNGVLFALYHSFQIWLFPQLLVASLGMALLVWLTRSVWPAVAGHLAGNFLFGMLGMVVLVLGIAA